MVLESLIAPPKAERRPWEMFFLGFGYSAIGVLLALWVFKQWASMVMVFLTAMASIPLMYRTLRYEEHEDLEIKEEYPLIKQHSKAALFFLMLFLGFSLTFSLLYLFLPSNLLKTTFSAQISTIHAINRPTGSAISLDIFMKIFANNMRVLFFCIFFSFFYGAGAIFILAWNASVIGAAIGSLARSKINESLVKFGFVNAGHYFNALYLGVLRYTPHGLLEVIGFFVGGLAGGIISVAVVNHDFGSREFNHIIADSLDLLILAIIIIFLAAIIEVYVTPQLFNLANH